MLKGISPLISPDLLRVLAQMGHGDDIVFADAHFPGHSLNLRTLRADGVSVTELLDAVMPLLELDTYDPPLLMMAPVPGDELDPRVERGHCQAIRGHTAHAPRPLRLERDQFYERASEAFAVVMTGDTRPYANIILRKGVIRQS